MRIYMRMERDSKRIVKRLEPQGFGSTILATDTFELISKMQFRE